MLSVISPRGRLQISVQACTAQGPWDCRETPGAAAGQVPESLASSYPNRMNTNADSSPERLVSNPGASLWLPETSCVLGPSTSPHHWHLNWRATHQAKPLIKTVHPMRGLLLHPGSAKSLP